MNLCHAVPAAVLGLGVMLALFAGGCGGGSGPSGLGAEYGTVSLRIYWPVNTGEASAREIPAATDHIVVSVSAADVTPALTVTISESDVVSDCADARLDVPPGTARHIVVEAQDSANTVLAQGEATVDVAAGSTTQAVIRLSAAWDQTPGTWLWMIYIAGANNLEGYAYADINEMESIALGPNVRVVVQMDTYSGEGKARRYWIAQDSDTTTVSSPVVSDLGQVDSGNWQTLKDFIDWGVSSYPSQRYGVVIWNHGGGFRAADGRRPWRDIAWDDSTGNSISIPQIPQALAGIPGGCEILAMDACLMQMAEVTYEVRSVCDYCVASEETIPGTGFDYADAFTRVVSHYDQPAETVARDLVDSYQVEYSGQGVTLSVVDSQRIGDVGAALDSFAVAALAQWDTTTATQWSTAREASLSFTDTEYKDLGHFASRLQASLTDATLQGLASAVGVAASSAVVYTWSDIPNASGLSVWAPSDATGGGSLPHYQGLAIAQSTRWDELLTEASGFTPPALYNIELSWSEADVDNDSHLWDSQEAPNHCFWGNMTIPGARLLNDDLGYGAPGGLETTAIYQLIPGTGNAPYVFAARGGAGRTVAVTVRDADGVVVHTDTGTFPDGASYWYAFDWDPTTAVITTVDTFGPDPPRGGSREDPKLP